MFNQSLPHPRPNPGNIKQLRLAVAHGSALAMIADGKSVAFIANHLHQVQHRRAPVKHNGLVLGPVEVDHLFTLGNRYQRLRREPQRLERVGGCVQLPESAVNQDQRRHRLVLVFHALISAADNLAH